MAVSADTTATTPGIVRKRSGRYWSYKIDGAKVPGVTTITGYFVSGGLADYPAKAVAKYALNNWRTLSDMDPGDRYEALIAGRWAQAAALARAAPRYTGSRGCCMRASGPTIPTS